MVMMCMMDSMQVECVLFVLLFLKVGDVVVGQIVNILLFFGVWFGFVFDDEVGWLWVYQIQLIVVDFIIEIYDMYYLIGSGLYYEDQKVEVVECVVDFFENWLLKFFGYFDCVFEQNLYKNGYIVGNVFSYVDLMMFQLIEGLCYVFLKVMKCVECKVVVFVVLYDCVVEYLFVVCYLVLECCILFNDMGIFWYYLELDK